MTIGQTLLKLPNLLPKPPNHALQLTRHSTTSNVSVLLQNSLMKLLTSINLQNKFLILCSYFWVWPQLHSSHSSKISSKMRRMIRKKERNDRISIILANLCYNKYITLFLNINILSAYFQKRSVQKLAAKF